MRKLSFGLTGKVLAECAKVADENGFFLLSDAKEKVHRRYKSVVKDFVVLNSGKFSSFISVLGYNGYLRHVKRGKYQIYVETIDQLLSMGLLK